MAKFPFRKKHSGANDRHLQEELVNKYFDELDLRSVQNEAGDDVEFNADAVYSRIVDKIDQPLYKKRLKVSAHIQVVAAMSIVSLVSAVLILAYHYRYALLDRLDPIANKQLVAANGQTVNFTLADGTKIWLNAGSKLTYPETFRGEKREIKLEGEAFLDVTHDPAKAFIVHTGQVSTQVLGTSFNIKAYVNERFIKVDVLSGKVGVVTPAGKAKSVTTFLTPAEGVVFNKDGLSITKNKQVDVNALSSWKGGELVFKNIALPEVLNTINRHFNVTVKADVNLARCSITANFTNVSLENIMKIISKLVKGKAVQKGPAYQLKGRGC
jgi:transmembrane sensor